MTPTFIITSAIESSLGPLPADIRILQTMDTVRSIYRTYPDAKTVLIEGGARTPTSPLWNQLRGMVHVFMDMTNNDQIQHLQKNVMSRVSNKLEMGGNSGLAKTVAELTLMLNALDAINNHPDMVPARQVDRIFKISGRYQLSPLFDKSVYEDAGMKYVFKRRDASWMDANSCRAIGADHGFSSRLWSFDIGLLDSTQERLQAAMDDMIELSTDHYIDMEHLLYKHIGPTQAKELDNTHLFGTLGPNVSLVYD
jgi:hypothetical protein